MSGKDIVPPFELCKCIPAGEFDNSTMIWEETIDEIYRVKLKIRGKDDKSYANWIKKVNIYPAPMLQEIFSVLPKQDEHENKITICTFGVKREWEIGYTYNGIICNDRNLADAALRLWLKIQKGKE